MSVSEYNFFSGLGDNKKAQGALIGGILAGALVTYFITKDKQV